MYIYIFMLLTGKNIKEGVAIPSCDMLQPYINK